MRLTHLVCGVTTPGVSQQEESRRARAVERFFEAHREDPRLVGDPEGSGEVPYSVVYHRRMQHWLGVVFPQASEALELAAACQHIRRWMRPRHEYPEGKLAYKKWRADLAVFHGEQAETILLAEGYSNDTISRVKDLLQKKGLKTDAETQALEDAICLVFLENEFAAFAEKHDPEKIALILRKTWKKMSSRGHEEALRLAPALPEDLLALVLRALEREE